MDERQTALVLLLADLSDRRTKEAKAAAAGYSPKYVYRLLRDPDFQARVTEAVRQALNVSLPAVFGSLVQQAIDGDTKAAELLLKAGGWIAPSGGQTNVVTVRGAAEESGESFAARLRDRFTERQEAYKRDKGLPGVGRDDEE